MQDPSSELLSGSTEAREVPQAAISIVVPTRDRPESLRRCLNALAAQTCLQDLEVIVVDDGSAVPEAVADVVGRHPFSRLVRQDAAGPARARNAGAANARGEVICFTDDDCEPSKDWAERLVAAIRSGADAAAGRTVSGAHGAVAAASELIVETPASVVVSPDGVLSFAPSNNLACRAAVFAAVPFDERYPAAAGEDRDWCARLIAEGYVLRPEPSAALTHRPEATLRAFFAQQLRYGRGAFWFRRGGSVRHPIEPPAFYLSLLGRGFRRGLGAGILVAAAQGVTALGFLLEWVQARKP
jgi:glycosyltransferase involved in cell wall biosynthesis